MFNIDKTFLKTITLLYVEDDLNIAKEMYEVFDEEFLDVYMAHNGLDGLELFKKHKPDIVFTDIQMPKMNGMDMARKIREISPEVPIIISSAFNDMSHFKEAIDIGVSDYIVKPVKFNNMINSFNEVFQALYNKYKLEKKNQEIIKQKNKAIAATKSKSEFLANMSHEIRTPLNAIMGFIDILKEKETDEEKLKYLDIVNDSSKSLLDIINDILDFSKIESGKLQIDKVNFDTNKEFRLIKQLLKSKINEKNITFVVNYNKLPKYLYSDPLRIKQIIINLLSNSMKFTSEGKTIYLDIEYKDNNLFVSVKDEGIGITPNKLEHIFDAFTQEDSSTTRKYGGTGLGLTISSKLVELLGGELKVKSEVGKGSEFYFSIPVEVGKEIKTEDSNAQEFDFSDKKILLVEDNKANQMFMKVLLKKLKLNFDIANDGVEAVESFKTNSYDLILMDENMPNMDGIEATKLILEYEKEHNLTHTPIIALTANALKGDRERFLEAGIDEYLTKPLDRSKLSEVLKQFLV